MPLAVARQHYQRDIPGTSFLTGAAAVPKSATALTSTETTSAQAPHEAVFEDTPELAEGYGSPNQPGSLPPGADMEIERVVLACIEGVYLGNSGRFSDLLLRVHIQDKSELDRAARTVVSTAVSEPRFCEACAVLSLALQLRLPVVPAPGRGKSGERFSHALLDACQTEFEALFLSSPGPPGDPPPLDGDGVAYGSEEAAWVAAGVDLLPPHVRFGRMRAIIQLAGRLHGHGLLGAGVVKQMVYDLRCCGAVDWAHELLQAVGAATDHHGHSNLGVVPEEGSVASEGSWASGGEGAAY